MDAARAAARWFAQVLVAKFGADAAEDLAHNRRKTLAEFTCAERITRARQHAHPRARAAAAWAPRVVATRRAASRSICRTAPFRRVGGCN